MTTDVRELSPETCQLIRAAISDAYYDARNDGRTMEHAADDAVERLEPILASIDENAYLRGSTETREDLLVGDAVARGIAHKLRALADYHESSGTMLPPHEMRALAAEYDSLDSGS